jgi:type VI secretion system protein ImpF
MQNQEPYLKLSILDRLLDDDPKTKREPVRERAVGIGHIKAAVVRDLENLLNTRRHIASPPATHREVNHSLWVYGLQDYTAQNPKSPSVKQHLRLDIEKTLGLFEHRLRNVTVKLEAFDREDRNLRFRITAMLVVDPVEEPVTFDTFFDLNRGEYKITG